MDSPRSPLLQMGCLLGRFSGLHSTRAPVAEGIRRSSPTVHSCSGNTTILCRGMSNSRDGLMAGTPSFSRSGIAYGPSYAAMLLRTPSLNPWALVESLPGKRAHLDVYKAKLTRKELPRRRLSSALGHGSNGYVRATVEEVKHAASEKFFIPSRTRSYAILGRPARTEFRHDSCNTAPL
jgi:hypothetical protein